MSILTRYLLRHFLSGFLQLTGVILVMILLIDGISTLQRFSGRVGFNWEQTAWLILHRVPPLLTLLIPAIAFLTTLFVTHRLNHQNEITVLRGSGHALQRVLRPFLIAGLLIAIPQVSLQEWLTPQSHWTAQRLKDALSGKEPRIGVASKLFWHRSGHHFLHVERLADPGPGYTGITLLGFDGDHRPTILVTAARGGWNQGELQLDDGILFTLTGEGRVEPFKNRSWPLGTEPAQLGKGVTAAKYLSTMDLWRQAERLRRAGHDANAWRVTLHGRFTAPVITLVAIFLAFPFALRLTRRAGVARSIFIGLVLGFALFMVTDLTTALGLGGRLPPVLAAWSPVALFIGIGLLQLLERERPQ